MSRWRRFRWPLLAGGFLVLVAALAVLVSPTGNRADLDPDSAAPGGSRAVARILTEQGVAVARVTRGAQLADRVAPGTTLLVARSELLGPDRLAQIGSLDADLVLVEPDAVALGVLAPGVVPSGVVDARLTAPDCSSADALAAGRVLSGGHLYRAGPGAAGYTACYPDPDPAAGTAYSLVTGTEGDHRVTVLGQSALLTNAELAREGNAALALRLLGEHRSLVWYLPDPLDAGNAGPGITELRPRWWTWLFWQLVLAAVVAMVWRARRLGRLVPEPLPVVVRAAETEEGRARLYRASRARGRAAATLRTATIRRLARRLDAPPEATPRGVVRMVAQSTGRPEQDVAGLLLGPEPEDDGALVWLADQLDALEAALADPTARSSRTAAGVPTADPSREASTP